MSEDVSLDVNELDALLCVVRDWARREPVPENLDLLAKLNAAMGRHLRRNRLTSAQ